MCNQAWSWIVSSLYHPVVVQGYFPIWRDSLSQYLCFTYLLDYICHGRFRVKLRLKLYNNWGQLFTVDSICNIEETGDIYWGIVSADIKSCLVPLTYGLNLTEYAFYIELPYKKEIWGPRNMLPFSWKSK